MIWKSFSAGVLVLTALAHSTGGYRAVVAPLLDTDGSTVAHGDAILLKFAWHGLAALMVLGAAVIAWPGTPRSLLIFCGLFWIVFGFVDIVSSRFAHPGWIPMILAGSLAIAGALR